MLAPSNVTRLAAMDARMLLETGRDQVGSDGCSRHGMLLEIGRCQLGGSVAAGLLAPGSPGPWAGAGLGSRVGPWVGAGWPGREGRRGSAQESAYYAQVRAQVHVRVWGYRYTKTG